MRIVNLTQHPASPEQIAAGVVDLPADLRVALADLLTFRDLPDESRVRIRASAIAGLIGVLDPDSPRDTEILAAGPITAAMIGGAPYLMGPLEAALRLVGIAPVYAFSVRESVEDVQPDGSTRKVAVFRHLGFVGLA